MEELYHYFNNYSVTKINDSNINEVFELCKHNNKYYTYLQETATLDGVKNIISELPPHTTLDNKHFVGFYKDNKLVAILDLIDGYPNKKTAFIGLFMVDINLQRLGVGKNIISELIKFLKSKKFIYCDLGVIETNTEAISFWNKLGFKNTGKIYNHEKYNVIMMSNKL
ncbi:MAG: GNAT family N-acetyltransferase [Clostridia bacterium]|nr:GNAT family N-acetyltransferase [Clostridia bacterium]